MTEGSSAEPAGCPSCSQEENRETQRKDDSLDERSGRRDNPVEEESGAGSASTPAVSAAGPATVDRGGWDFRSLPPPSSSGGGADRSIPLEDLRRSFELDGFLCLSSLLSPALMRELRNAAEVNFAECFRQLHEGGHAPFPSSYRRIPTPRNNKGSASSYEYPLSQGVAGGFAEIVMRSPGRYEMPFGCDAPPFGDEVLKVAREAGLMSLVRTLLDERDGDDEKKEEEGGKDGGDECQDRSSGENGNGTAAEDDDPDEPLSQDDPFYLSNLSLVVSTPGSSDQGWHADGGHVDVHAHRPCHCLNVFVPLVDVLDRDLGPTELRPGTHVHTRNLAPMMLAARARRTLRPPAVPRMRAGDALVFDYRVLHRGLANRTECTDRPILVMTFAKRWFKDVLNFPKRSMGIENPRKTVR